MKNISEIGHKAIIHILSYRISKDYKWEMLETSEICTVEQYSTYSKKNFIQIQWNSVCATMKPQLQYTNMV